MYAVSGTGGVSKTDEFFEKLQTAFDPPSIFGKSSCKSFIQFRAQKSTTNPEHRWAGGGVKVLNFPLFCLKKLFFFALKNSLFVS